MAPVLSNGLDLLILYIAYSGWLASEIVGAGILPRLRQKKKEEQQKKTNIDEGNERESDRGSKGAIFLGVFSSIFIAFSFAYNGVALLPRYLFPFGVGLMILGVVVRQWAIVTLGRFFSLSVRVTSDQSVVSSGPYRLVRHPSYSGALMTLAGLALALESWGALLVILAMFGLVYGYRMRVEEWALKAQLGEAYLAYAKRTKRLIPYLL